MGSGRGKSHNSDARCHSSESHKLPDWPYPGNGYGVRQMTKVLLDDVTVHEIHMIARCSHGDQKHDRWKSTCYDRGDDTRASPAMFVENDGSAKRYDTQQGAPWESLEFCKRRKANRECSCGRRDDRFPSYGLKQEVDRDSDQKYREMLAIELQELSVIDQAEE